MQIMQKSILTIRQTAKLLQVDPNTVYRWARVGKFPGSKIGKEWRVLHSDVIRFVESHRKRNQFLSEDQEAELMTALIGRREIPLKFEYLGEGADRYTALSHYGELAGQSDYQIFEDHAREVEKVLGSTKYNLLDLGCGDGKKAAFFMSMFNKNAINYFPLDISQRMLDIASSNMNLAHPEIEIETFENDFEQGHIANVTYYLQRRYKHPNLIYFVGQTIGNISDAYRVLINLTDSMREDDLLLVGLAYYNSRNIPLDSYNDPSVIKLISTVPEKLGIKEQDAKVYWTYNSSKRQLEAQLEFTKDWSKTFGVNLLRFGKRQRIRLGISRRFTKEDIFELFANAGFKIELLVHDKDNALILCRPHSWEKKV